MSDTSSALNTAFELAESSGVDRGPNPAVGCVLLTEDGRECARGWHQGPGTPHAEVMALQAAGEAARGSTAVVTLEPCNHHGRTPPCAEALIAAGVTEVIYAQRDPNPLAAGGAQRLESAGVTTRGPVDEERGRALNASWTMAMGLQRPVVVWKVASSLDGRIAAADGTSRWITSAVAREDTHRLRERVDAIMTSTGTALSDWPLLTARPGGHTSNLQPQRYVVGRRPLPAEHPLASVPHLATHEPREVLDRLWQDDIRTVMLEAGPQLSGAFLAADLIDQIVWFTAPLILGAGGTPVSEDGPATLTDATEWAITSLSEVAPDVRIDLLRTRAEWMGENGRPAQWTTSGAHHVYRTR